MAHGSASRAVPTAGPDGGLQTVTLVLDNESRELLRELVCEIRRVRIGLEIVIGEEIPDES